MKEEEKQLYKDTLNWTQTSAETFQPSNTEQHELKEQNDLKDQSDPMDQRWHNYEHVERYISDCYHVWTHQKKIRTTRRLLSMWSRDRAYITYSPSPSFCISVMLNSSCEMSVYSEQNEKASILHTLCSKQLSDQLNISSACTVYMSLHVSLLIVFFSAIYRLWLVFNNQSINQSIVICWQL